MNNMKSLTYWTAACLAARDDSSGSGIGSDAYNVLIDAFAAVPYQITITGAQMDGIVGVASQMLVQVNAIEALLIANPTKMENYELVAPIIPNKLAMV
jgi:hypothetical protein